MKKLTMIMCLLVVVLFMTPINVVFSAANGGDYTQSQIMLQGDHTVRTFVTGYIWHDYPEALWTQVAIETCLMKNGQFLYDYDRWSPIVQKHGPVGESKYVSVNGSTIAYADYIDATHSGNSYKTVSWAYNWNSIIFPNVGIHTHYSSTIVLN